MSSANAFSGFFLENFNVLTEYFYLREQNQKLAEENTRYRNSFDQSFKSNIVTRQQIRDSVYQQQYFYISARIINNSVNKQYNYITLNRGRRDGLLPDMAVITDDGAVGIVQNVSNNFALVVSVLNRKIGISAKIKKNGYFGSARWDGEDYNKIKLKEIPNHVHLEPGDTVVTSGFSTIFPEGIPIGVISDFKQESGTNFYDITLRLTTNFKNISHVYVVGDLLKTERKELEEISEQ